MEISKESLMHIISATIMCVKDEHPDGIAGSSEYLSTIVLKVTQDKELAQHAANCVIAAGTVDEDNSICKESDVTKQLRELNAIDYIRGLNGIFAKHRVVTSDEDRIVRLLLADED